eukprot:gene20226-24215_t
MRPLHGDGAVEKYVAGKIAAEAEQHPSMEPYAATLEATREECDMIWEFEGVTGRPQDPTGEEDTNVPPYSPNDPFSGVEASAETPPE